MVLSNENNYYTNILSLVMLLVAPISGLTVRNSRFSQDPTIAYIHHHLFKKYSFQIEHCYDTSQNIHTPYSCICLFSLFFTAKVYCRPIIFKALFSGQFSALHYFIFSVYTNLNFKRMFSSTFQIFLHIFNKKILQSDIFTAFFQHLSFWKKWSQCLGYTISPYQQMMTYNLVMT